ncbi:MAG: ABC transporter permease subunit [Saprospiraceae bacterium]|nr:ABC transporter permease subunit [Saprospiraceae bacterium]MCZ2337573.1 ABC transporter permease subunit [Chitinophagales bacterium]
MDLSWLIALRGNLTKRQQNLLAVIGFFIFILAWAALTMGSNPIIPRNIFPDPKRVFNAFGELFTKNELIKNVSRSLGLNLGGYIKAVAYAIPVGFAIGLVPALRGAFQKLVDAIRFLPLTALTGLFIIWFGIYSEQKINFLAFGIFIYLLPIVIQRIDEVDDVYLKTVHTLGASYWQTIFTVYLPSVLSRLSDDIRILTAISWTYIIVAETSADQGGIGSLIYRAGQRLGRVDITIACLIIIMLIGVFQDRTFAYLDRKFFPHKYQQKASYDASNILKTITYWDIIFDYIISTLIWIFIGLYILLTINEFVPFLGGLQPLGYLFGDTLWTVHFVFVILLSYQIYSLISKLKNK